MSTLWFWLVAVMLSVYVLLDGFDLGVGLLHLGLGRTDLERRTALSTIAPVWDGNEVWLLAGGGVLYFAFPALYASGFSGFYLPLMIVLWLLMLRGISIEFRNHLAGPVWAPLWDTVFSGSSALLAIFYGAALGNVVRGVPLDASGFFFEPLWTNFRVGPEPGILDWYTILVGLAAYFALALHGALWVVLKTQGIVAKRARRYANLCWWPVVALTATITIVSFRIQPQLAASFALRPIGYAFPALAVAGLAGIFWSLRSMSSPGHGHNHPIPAEIAHELSGDPARDSVKHDGQYSPLAERNAFLASCAYLLGMMTSVVFGLYPLVLPASGNSAYSLTVANASAADHGLKVGEIWWFFGMVLATGYFVFLYRTFRGKVAVPATHDGHTQSRSTQSRS